MTTCLVQQWLFPLQLCLSRHTTSVRLLHASVTVLMIDFMFCCHVVVVTIAGGEGTQIEPAVPHTVLFHLPVDSVWW